MHSLSQLILRAPYCSHRRYLVVLHTFILSLFTFESYINRRRRRRRRCERSQQPPCVHRPAILSFSFKTIRMTIHYLLRINFDQRDYRILSNDEKLTRNCLTNRITSLSASISTLFLLFKSLRMP